jgi:hypothetical protein
MEILNNYFEGLTFKYIEEKQSYAIYAASIYGLLSATQQRYVFAFVPKHSLPTSTHSLVKLSALPWKNLQTRICEQEKYKIQPQTWKAPTTTNNINFSVKLRGQDYSTFNFDASNSNISSFPYEVTMIHNHKKKSVYQYPNNMNLDWAIDQFQTIFNFIETVIPENFYPKLEEYIPNAVSHIPNNLPHPLQSWINKTSNNSNYNNSNNEDLIEFL